MMNIYLHVYGVYYCFQVQYTARSLAIYFKRKRGIDQMDAHV